MNAKEYREAGLYDPESPDAASRLELLDWLTAQGVAVAEMKEADAQGMLSFVASAKVLRPGPFLTQQQLADRLGVSLREIEVFRVAFALPPVAPDAPWCNEAEAEMFQAVAGGVVLFGEKGMLRLARVLGSSVSRIAEAMVTANQERMREVFAADASELEIAKAVVEASATASAPANIIRGLLSIHVQIAGTRIRARRANLASETTNGCVGFVDLVGSTTLSRRLTSSELAEVVDRFEEVAHGIATNRGGRVVKFIGDEVMFVTGDADSACDIALSLIEAFADDESVTPRAGLAMGEMLDRGGDYYGPVVNLASRLGELAVPSEVLVSKDVADGIRDPALRSDPAGRRQLRGFDEPVPVLSVTRLARR